MTQAGTCCASRLTLADTPLSCTRLGILQSSRWSALYCMQHHMAALPLGLPVVLLA